MDDGQTDSSSEQIEISGRGKHVFGDTWRHLLVLAKHVEGT